MAEAFDPYAYASKGAKAFDPLEYIRKKDAAAAEPAPAPQDPTEQLFVSREAATDTRPLAERAAKVGEEWGKTGLIAGDTATFGLGNRAIGYGRALLDAAQGDEFNYDKRITEQANYLKRIREEDPVRAAVGDVVGGMTGGAGLARAGITLAKPGAGWLSSIARGATEGALQSAAQGAGQSYGTVGQKVEAAIAPGTLLGGIAGGAIPGATHGAAGVKTLFDITRGNIPKYPPALLRAVDADRAGVEALPAKGPAAMLVDAGPSMLRQGAAAKTTPGPGSSALETALREREAQTIARMRAGTEKSLGPDVVPSHVEADIKAAQKAMGPEWESAFQRAKAVDTTDVANYLDAQIINKRGAAADALSDVRKALNVKGTNELDPYPRTLHETREMIDGMLAKQDIDPKVANALRDARTRITEELHAKVPGMANLDAKYAEVSSRLRAFERGQELFDRGRNQTVRPVEWATEKAAMYTPKGGPRASVKQPAEAPHYSELGTRAEIGRRVGEGTDDLRTLEKMFGEDNFATLNLKTQFGVKNVEDFQHLIRTNRQFREAYNKIVHGSKTADTIEAAADAERGYFAMPRFSVGGAIDFVGDRLAQAQQGFGAGVRNRIAELMATRGQGLDELRRDLLNAAAEQARADITRSIVENALRRGASSVAPYINPRR